MALLLAIVLAACEVEVGGFGASVGDEANFAITMYQGQDVIGGEKVDFEEVIDQGPLVLYFLGSQCEQCPSELSTLQAFYDQHRDRLTVLAVDVGHLMATGNRAEGKGMLAEANTTFPAGYADDPFVVQEHEIDELPTTSFYKKGSMHYRVRVSGGLWESDLLENLDEILSRPPDGGFQALPERSRG